MKYRIRYNKSRGQPGRGSPDHAWRVFDETGKEIICKNFQISVPCKGEKDPNSDDWNVTAEGILEIDRETSTVLIKEPS